MAVQGIFTSDASFQGDRKQDFAAAILETIATGDAPLFALSSGVKDIPAKDTRVQWYEIGFVTGRIEIIQPPQPAASGVTIGLRDTSMLSRGSILLVEATGERIFVLGVTGTHVTVERGFAGSLPQPITSAPGALGWVKMLSKAFEEGSDPPPGYTFNPQARSNLTQIIRSTAAVTGTAAAVHYNYATAQERTNSTAMVDHATAIEMALLFGRKSENVQNGAPLRTMDGLTEMIQTNRFVVPSTGLSYNMLDTITEVAYRRKVRGYPNERVVYGGNRALTVMNRLARAHSLHCREENVTKFGMNINTWVTPHGELKIITHPMMNADPILAGTMIIYHPGLFRRRTLRPTTVRSSDYLGGRDTLERYYLTELSCQYGCEDTGVLVEGIFNAETGGTWVNTGP